MRSAPVRRTSLAAAAIVLLGVMAAAPTPARAQGNQTKRCIEAAESGQQSRGSGRLTEARKSFGICTAPACPAAVRRDCARWIEEVDAAIPTIAVRLEDEGGREITDGRVTMDGDTPIQPSAGRAVPVDPGAHRFVWVRPDGNVEEEVVIREGEHNRAIILRPRGKAIGPVDPSKSGGDKTSTGSASPWPWVIGGLGTAAVVTGAVFWAVGLGEHSDLERTCAAAHACVQNDIDSSRSKLVVGDVMMGIGLVAIAGAVILYVLQDGDVKSPAAATR